MGEKTVRRHKKNSQIKEIWKRMKKSRSAMFGLVVIVIFILAAIFADLIVDYQKMAIEQNGMIRLQPPSWEHWFGTDAFGRDVFARIIHGTRVSLTVGLFATTVSCILGGLLGAITGYYKGRIDSIIMRAMDIIQCIPSLLLALAIVAALGPGIFNVLLAITVSSVPGFVRITRSVILTAVDQEYVEAAKACGTRDARIIYRHILPNAMGPIIVQATMSVAGMILVASGLSFLGMGMQPPAPEWGAMLTEGKEYMRNAPYLVAFPGLAIIFAALSISLFGDGLRDAIDPKLKN
jgi:peptide/nickel transport system permease protein